MLSLILLSITSSLVAVLLYQNRALKKEHERLLNESQEDTKLLFLKSRYASMGETVGNIAHQWKQPLNAIGAIQNSIKASLIFQGDISKEKLLNSVETSFKLLQHLAETIDTFYSFLSQRSNETMSFNVSDELDKVRKITEYSFENSNITLNFELEINPMIQGNANEFTHSILNLILNAKDAFDNSPPLNPMITVHVSEQNQTCIITVSDNAGGIRLSPVDMIFDMHITTKESGSGLGLFMTKKIIEQRFGGSISVENKHGGACFTITLPYSQYSEHYADTLPNNEKLSLDRINQLSRKVIELEEVEKTLKKWADIFQKAHWGIAIHIGTSNHFESTNEAFNTLYGYTYEELRNISVPDLFPPETLSLLPEVQQRAFEKGYVVFETINKRRDGTTFPVSVELIVVKDDDGKILYHMANIWDMSEKKASEENLLLKEFALNTINEAVYLIDEESMFHYVNDEACTALGYTKEELLTMGVIHIDPNATREWWRNHWAALKEQKNMLVASSHRRKDGSVFPIEVSINYFEYNTKGYNLAVVRNITERLQLEAQKENERMRLFFERQLVGMAITSPEYGWVHTNEKLQQMLGYTHEELSALTWTEMTYPEDLAPDIEQFERLLRGKIEEYTLEKRFIRKDGSIVYTNLAVSCVRNDDRSVNYVLALLEDITQRKAAQEALAAKDQELRALADSSPGMMGAYHLKPDGSVCMPYVSPNIVDIFGVTPEEVREDAAPLMALHHPEDTQRVHDSIAQSAESMSVWHEEYRINHPIKGERWMESNTMPQPHPDGGIVWYGYVHDITERKELETLLEKERKFLIDAQRVAHTGSWYLDITKGILLWSDETYRIFELDKEHIDDLHKTFYERVHPDDREMVSAPYVESLKTKLPYEMEHRIVMSDGRIKYVIERCEHFYDNNGTPLYSIGTVQDITERKEMETLLQNANDRYIQILDNSIDVIYLIEVTPQGHFVYVDVNAAYEEVTGIARDLVIGLDVEEIEDAIFRTILIDKFTTCLNAEGKTDYIADYPFPAGIRTFHSVLFPIRDESGRIVRIVGIARDITERQETEESLKKALEFNEGIIGAIPDLLFEVTPEGIYVGVWAQDDGLLAVQKEMMLGNNFKEILPPNAVITALQAIKEVDEKGVSLGKTYSLDLPEGKRWFELSVSKKKMSGNYIVLARDITERKRMKIEVENSHNFLDQLINSIHDPIFVKDRDHRWIILNNANIALTGLPREALIGKTDHDIFPKEQADVFWAKDEEVFRSKEININEEYFTSADGVTHCIETIKSMFVDTKGDEYLVGTIRDITKRKDAEESLKSNRNLLHTILESSPGIITFALDTHYRYIAFDSKHAEVMKSIFGKEVALGINMLELITSDTERGIAKRSFDRALGGESFIAEEEYTDERLSHHYWQIFYAPIHSERGEIIGFACFNMDITDRRQKEETIRELNTVLEEKVKERTVQLQQSLEFSEGVINALPDLLFEIDRNGTYLNIWARDEELLAAQKELLLGHTLHEMLSKESADTMMEALGEADSNGTSFGKIIKIDLPQGSRYFEQSVSKKSSTNTFVLISRDITERLEGEKWLKMVEMALNSSAEAVYINNKELSIIYVNDEACRMLGYSRDELLSMKILEIDAKYTLQEIDEIIKTKIREGKVIFETQHRKKDGSVIDVEIAGSFFIHEEDTIFISLVKEIS